LANQLLKIKQPSVIPGFGITMGFSLLYLSLMVLIPVSMVCIDAEAEEAASCLGATKFQTFRKVILPALLPAILTGFALAFARALGEYGSVVFISGNMPMVTEITPLLIRTKLEQYNYAGATAIAAVMLLISFVLLLLLNLTQWWASNKDKY